MTSAAAIDLSGSTGKIIAGSGGISSTGNVTLTSAAAIDLSGSTGKIIAGSGGISSTGNVTLTSAAAIDLSGSTGKIIAGSGGISSTGNVTLTSAAAIDLSGSTGKIIAGSGGISSTGNILLTSTAGISLSGSGSIQVGSGGISVISTGYISLTGSSATNVIDATGKQITAGTFNTSSDYRMKENVISVSETSISTKNLRPVVYNLKTNTKEKEAKKSIGFIAHELQESIPCLVSGEKDGKEMQSINYIGIIGVLVKEVQDLQNQLADVLKRLSDAGL